MKCVDERSYTSSSSTTEYDEFGNPILIETESAYMKHLLKRSTFASKKFDGKSRGVNGRMKNLKPLLDGIGLLVFSIFRNF